MEQVQQDPVIERVTIERLEDGTLRWYRYNREAGGAENIPELSPAEALLAASRVIGRADVTLYQETTEESDCE